MPRCLYDGVSSAARRKTHSGNSSPSQVHLVSVTVLVSDQSTHTYVAHACSHPQFLQTRGTLLKHGLCLIPTSVARFQSDTFGAFSCYHGLNQIRSVLVCFVLLTHLTPRLEITIERHSRNASIQDERRLGSGAFAKERPAVPNWSGRRTSALFKSTRVFQRSSGCSFTSPRMVLHVSNHAASGRRLWKVELRRFAILKVFYLHNPATTVCNTRCCATAASRHP